MINITFNVMFLDYLLVLALLQKLLLLIQLIAEFTNIVYIIYSLVIIIHIIPYIYSNLIDILFKYSIVNSKIIFILYLLIFNIIIYCGIKAQS